MTKSDDDWNPTTFGFNLKQKEKDICLNFFRKDCRNVIIILDMRLFLGSVANRFK